MPVIPYVDQSWADGSGGGTPISAARLAIIEAGIKAAHYMPAVRVYHNANQSITNNTITALAFNSERFDQAAGSSAAHHDTVTNNSRLTCLYAGIYQILGMVEWGATATNAELGIRLNGTGFSFTTAIGYRQVVGDERRGQISTIYSLAVNDYVELVVRHNAGVSVNVNSTGNYSPEFMMTRVA